MGELLDWKAACPGLTKTVVRDVIGLQEAAMPKATAVEMLLQAIAFMPLMARHLSNGRGAR